MNHLLLSRFSGTVLVDPGYGPSYLEMRWRLLYELVVLHQALTWRPTDGCVLERNLVTRLEGVLGAALPANKWAAVHTLASVDPAAHLAFREAVEGLRQEGYLVIVEPSPDDPEELRIAATHQAYCVVADWHHHWLTELERRAKEPPWWRTWSRHPLIVGVISAITAAVVTLVLSHYLLH